MRRVLRVALTAGGTTALFAAVAHGDATPPPASYSLSWVRAKGAQDCPTERALVAEVERRLGRSVFDAAADRSFEVEVSRLGDRYRSEVYVRDESGNAVGHRTLESDEAGCAALFSATALAIALVIDPDAVSRIEQSGAVAAFETPTLPAPAPPAASPVVPPVLVPAASPRVAAAPAEPIPNRSLPVPVTIAVRAQAQFGALPAPSPGFALAFSARPWPRVGFVVSGAYAAPQFAREGNGVFEFSVTRASAAVSFDVATTEGTRFALSAGPTLSLLHLAVWEPPPITNPGDFVAIGAELTAVLQWRVWRSVFVEIGAAGSVPLNRQEFYARGQAEAVWRQPLVAGTIFFGVGAQFP